MNSITIKTLQSTYELGRQSVSRHTLTFLLAWRHSLCNVTYVIKNIYYSYENFLQTQHFSINRFHGLYQGLLFERAHKFVKRITPGETHPRFPGLNFFQIHIIKMIVQALLGPMFSFVADHNCGLFGSRPDYDQRSNVD